MPTVKEIRKLAAILHADVKGYSRLMGDDEALTVNTLSEFRQIFSDNIKKHAGRIVNAPGDSILAEFPSVVSAVQSAVEIQEQLNLKNADLPTHRKMEFRIGINLGDVIQHEDAIYGDGVNIAARVEALAEPGGISISQYAYDHAHKKLKWGYEFQGEHRVKNITNPVRVYKVLTAPEHAGQLLGETKAQNRTSRKLYGLFSAVLALMFVAAIWYFYPRAPQIEPASVDKMAYPLPDKPSIAVLPFVNMSRDPDQEYFADGISENIISALSHIPEMFVIARNSTFTYKGKPVRVQQVSEELGVRYVLEGSIQRSGNKIRVTAQLIDATTGHNLWAERYDRELKDVFALQDEITLKILSALQVKLTEGEQARLWSTTDNLEAWSNVIKGSSLFEQFERQSNSRAQHLYEKATKLDPNWDIAWIMLAWTHWAEARFGWNQSPAEAIRRAVEIAQKVAAINDTLPELHLLWSNIYLLQGDHEKAITEGKKAIALGPNNALCHVLLAYAMNSAGRFEEAIKLGEKAVRLSPYSSPWYLMILADAYRMAGRYEEALTVGKHYLDRCSKGECNSSVAHMGLAATYSDLGRKEKAHAHAAEILKIYPDFSLDDARKIFSFKDPIHTERALDALRQAGLPEHVQLPLPDKPSIAVLPFENMSDDPKQEYFSDGLTEDLITDLSKFRGLFVISRNSVFIYKGQAIKPEQVRQELGVRYMLEGSVRKSGNRVRITAQLIDTTTDGHLWGERYDRDLKDIFSLQDEITQQIVSALGVKFEQIEQERALHKDTANLNAYDYALRGWSYYQRQTKKDNDQARLMFEKAIEIEPNFAGAYAGLGFTYYEQWAMQWSQDPLSLDRALELAREAIALDNSLSEAYTLLSHVYLWKKQRAQAIAAISKTIELDPNDADSYADLAETLIWAGNPSEALGLIEKAMRLNPHYPVDYLITLGFAYSTMERFAEGETALKTALARSPDHIYIHLMLAVIYSEIGRKEEARSHVAEAMRVNPQLSLEVLSQRLPALHELAIDALRKAGLPE